MESEPQDHDDDVLVFTDTNLIVFISYSAQPFCTPFLARIYDGKEEIRRWWFHSGGFVQNLSVLDDQGTVMPMRANTI